MADVAVRLDPMGEVDTLPPKRLQVCDSWARARPSRDAMGLSARLLPELPLAPSLGLHVPGVPGVVQVALDSVQAAAARAEGELVIDAEEWRALTRGAEADRLWPLDFAALCARKRHEPTWRIDREVALGGAQPDLGEEWTAARVLERVGAELLSVELPG